jgi:iron complex transport system substrate-binding protein
MALFLITALLTGCGGSASSTKRTGIITMGPHITETVFALGRGKNVVAVGALDDYPAQVRDLPNVGGYINPDLEKITMLAPAKLIVAGRYPKITEYAESNNVPLLNVDMDSLDGIDQGIVVIGHELGCPNRADQLRTHIKAVLQSVRATVESLPHPKVLLITGRQSHDLNTLNTVNGASFLSELLTVAGGENVFADAPQTYFEASKESVVMKEPEVILEFHCGEGLTEKQKDAYFTDWVSLSTLPAVKSNRIFFITDSFGMRPGPRIGEVAKIIARQIHGELTFPEVK